MHSGLDAHDRECLNELRQRNGGSVHDLCDVFGVTPTAIRQRLSRLSNRNLVTRQAVRREGRGRPRYVYHLTDEGLRQLGDNYGDLAMVLWQEIQAIEEPRVRSQLFERVRSALVEKFGKVISGATLSERMQQLESVMGDRGYDIEYEERDGLPILRETNCPYPELASHTAEICLLEQEVFSKILDTPVELTRCWRDGESCCEFRPQLADRTELQHEAVLIE